VFDVATDEPIEGAVLDFWQADEFGNYHAEHLRGKIRSSSDGSYVLHTIVPEAYTLHADDSVAELFALLGRHAYRAAHIHLKVWIDGAEALTTQFFDSGSRFLDSDYVVGAVRPELVVARELDPDSSPDNPSYRMHFDIPVTRPAAVASNN
jgi:protocatechuate 3,4-dioxygenase beta subunit